jgi:hypothetical protein
MATTGIRVTGSSSCPTPADVEQRVEKLETDRAEAPTATLETTPAGLDLELHDAEGRLIARRTMASNPSCEEQAEMAAVLLASWLSDLGAPSMTAQRLPDAAPSLAQAVESPKPPRGPSPWSWEVGVGPTGSFDSSGFAPGVAVEAGVGPSQAAWTLHLMGAYEGPRQLAVGTGTVSWQDWQVGLGASYAFSPRPYRFELMGYGLLADVDLSGAGFPVNATSQSLQVGLNLGARLLLLEGEWHPWLGAGTTVWLRQELPVVVGTPSSMTLPRVTGFVGLGIVWRS